MALSTPQAIVLGFALAGTLCGTGLYFGLRGRTPSGAPVVSASEGPASIDSTTSSTVSSSGAAAPAATQSPVDADAAGRKVASEVRATFAARHAQAIEECWQPAVAKNPEPATQTVTFELGFDASGAQTFRSLLAGRATRPEVNSCLLRVLEVRNVAAPGAPARVRVPFTLP